MLEFIKMYRRWFIGGTIVLVFLIAASIVYHYIASYQYLTVNFDTTKVSSAKLYIGSDSSTENTIAPTDKIAINSLESGEKYRLEKGAYYIELSGKDVSKTLGGILLDDKPIEKSYMVSYTQLYLKNALVKEKDAIENAIITKYPKIPGLYSFSNESLYGDGTWYAAALVYKNIDSLDRDTLRIVAHKVNGVWSEISAPRIVLSYTALPNIPRDVIDTINTIDNQTPLMPYFTLYSGDGDV